MNLQIALLVASHFALSISVRRSPSEMVNLLFISSIDKSKIFNSDRFSAFLLFISISILFTWLALHPTRLYRGRKKWTGYLLYILGGLEPWMPGTRLDVLVFQRLNVLFDLLIQYIHLSSYRTGHCLQCRSVVSCFHAEFSSKFR